jgi:methionyl aminopeptidase
MALHPLDGWPRESQVLIAVRSGRRALDRPPEKQAHYAAKTCRQRIAATRRLNPQRRNRGSGISIRCRRTPSAAGFSTQEIDDLVVRETLARNAKPYFRDYNGFPKHCTTSVSEEVINTLPSSRRLENGDLLKLQLGVRVGKRFAMQSWTYAIGEVGVAEAAMMAAGVQALRAGARAARTGARTGDISTAIEREFGRAKMSPSRTFVGHAVGKAPHQDPAIPCRGRAGIGRRVKAGTVLSIVALGHAGSPGVDVLEDGWNTVARDGEKSVLFSQMLRVAATPELLLPERGVPSS